MPSIKSKVGHSKIYFEKDDESGIISSLGINCGNIVRRWSSTAPVTAPSSPSEEGCDFILDCFDKNNDRLAVNKACLHFGIPAAHGFAEDFNGELFTVIPGKSACLTCALDESFPEPDVTPVIGVATGMMGVAIAAAAILNLTGIGDPMGGHRLIYDLAFPGVTKILVSKNLNCSVCGR